MEIPNKETRLIRYTCKDIGVNCTFVVKAESLDEVIKQALAHVRENHANDFNSINTPAEIEQMEKALIRSTRVVKQ